MASRPSADRRPSGGGLTVGSRRLRAELATFLQRAEAGEHLTVTVGGRPVARLGPLDAGPSTRPDSLEAMAQLGLIDQPRRPQPRSVNRDTSGRPPGWGLPADVRVDRLLRQLRG